MREILDEIVDRLKAGQSCALSRALERTGSVPTPADSHLLVGADFTRGTVGGGLVEAEIVLRSREALDGGGSRLSEYSFDSEQVQPGSMLCGGQITFFTEILRPEELALWQKVREAACLDSQSALVTLVTEGAHSAGAGRRMLVREGRVLAGGLPDTGWEKKVLAALEAGANGLDPLYLALGKPLKDYPGLRGFLVEPLRPEPTLIVYGGGHVGRALCRVAALAGFRVAVVDDRAEYADPQRFPEAWRVVHSGFEESFGKLTPGPGYYLVSVTRCHDQDREVIAHAVNYPADYIGMIGSRRKVKVLWEYLRGQGVDPERLAQVHAPVGLAIGAETPEEIAVSIAAQLIQVRRGRKPSIGRGTIQL